LMAKSFATTWCARCFFLKRWFCLIACPAVEDELGEGDG
jgi:hypothetical protein